MEKIAARLFLDIKLQENCETILDKEQSHYLGAVMRVKKGFYLKVFNGLEGEFLAEITDPDKRKIGLRILQQTRPQTVAPNLILYFAPLKKARMDYLIQKATELGVAALVPVITDHTNTDKLKEDKIRANILEAAEQTERLDIPELRQAISFEEYLKLTTVQNDQDHFICAEAGNVSPISDAVLAAQTEGATFMIGPEGGFSSAELHRISQEDHIAAIGLGPRILRADTAIISALSIWQAFKGDWKNQKKEARPPLRGA